MIGIETSGATGRVALVQDGRLAGEHAIQGARRHASLLTPALADLFAVAGDRSLDLVAVGIGPGSYTGIRVGLMCAKTLAYATGAAIVGVNSLEVIAANAPLSAGEVHVVSDAQRGQVYAAAWRRRAAPQGDRRGNDRAATPTADWDALAPLTLMAAHDWAASIPADACVLGPGLERYRSLVPPHAVVLPDAHWHARAAALIQIALRVYDAGRRDDLWTLQPLYLRKSAAEETLNATGR